MSSLKFVHDSDANNKDFLCPICKEFLFPKDASQIIECSHIFCTSCLKEISSSLYSKVTCPLCNCNSKIDEVIDCNKFAYNTLSNVEIYCSNEGCEKKLTIDNLESHNSYCEFKIMDCPYCEKKNIMRKDLKAHLKENLEEHFLKLVDEINEIKKKLF